MAYQSNFKGDEVVALLNMVKNGGAGAVVRNLFTGDTLLDEEKAYNAETYQMVMEAEIPPIIMLGGGLPMFIDKHSTSTDTSIRIYYHVHIASEHVIALCKLGSDGTVTEETLAYDYSIFYENGDTKNTGLFNALRGAALFGNVIIEDTELGILRPVQILPIDENSVILVATDYSSGPFVNLVAYLVTSDDIVSRQVTQGAADTTAVVEFVTSGELTADQKATNAAVYSRIANGEKVVTFFKRDGEAYLMPMLHTDYDGHNVFFDLLQAFSSESGEAILGVSHIVMSSDGTVTASGRTYPLGGNSVEAAILEFNSSGLALTAVQKAHNAEIFQKIVNNETIQVFLNIGSLVPLQPSSISGTEIILSASAIITADSGSLRYQSVKLSSDGDLQMYEQKEYPLTGGGGSGSELREIYVADALDESQKAYNAETYNKIREGAGVLPYIKGANGAPRYLCNFTLWSGSTPYITMKSYVFDSLQDGEYTFLLVKLMSDGTASSEENEKTLASLAVDSTLSITSENPVQNKVVKTKFNEVDSWLTRLQNTVNDWVESLEELLGYFTEGKANDADKLDGHDSSHFATSEAVTQLSQKVDAIPTITVDTEMSDTSENAVQNKVIKAYVDDMKVKEVSRSAITQIELVPNTLYRLSDITSLVVTLAQGKVGVANYYMFEIAVGDAIPEITLPSSVRWMDGYDVLADLNKDTVYQISILNNLAVGGAFV